MKRVRLYPRSRDRRDEEWILELGYDWVKLFHHDGGVILDFHRSEAEARLRLPSFWQSVKHFGIVFAENDVEDCDVSPKALSIIQIYLLESTLAAGPKAVRSHLIWGLIGSIGGSLLIAIAVISFIKEISEGHVEGKKSNIHLDVGLLIFGLVTFGTGLTKLVQYRKLLRLIREREKAELPPDES